MERCASAQDKVWARTHTLEQEERHVLSARTLSAWEQRISERARPVLCESKGNPRASRQIRAQAGRFALAQYINLLSRYKNALSTFASKITPYVSRSLTFCMETKMPWRQTPSWKKKAIVFTNVTTNAYQGQLSAGFSKVCEIFKVCSIETLKYVREFHTPVWYCGDISTHWNVTLNKTNCDWLFDMSVKRPP